MDSSLLINKKSDPKVLLATVEQKESWIRQISLWEIKQNVLQRHFEFKNFYQTMAFVNAVAWIAHAEDHHPDLQVSYNRCVVEFSTHSVGGLSENDFICAAKVDHLSTV